MSEQRSLQAVEKLQLVNAGDDMRLAGDPFKLDFGPPTSLKSLVTARLSSLLAGCAGTAFAAGNEASAQEQFRTATDKLKAAHRGGFRWIDSQLPASIPQPDPLLPPHMSAAQRIHMMEVYLFGGGEVGDFTDLRILDMARQVPTALNLAMPNPAWHYPQPLVDHIALQMATAESAQAIAEVATRVWRSMCAMSARIWRRPSSRGCASNIAGRATTGMRRWSCARSG